MLAPCACVFNSVFTGCPKKVNSSRVNSSRLFFKTPRLIVVICRGMMSAALCSECICLVYIYQLCRIKCRPLANDNHSVFLMIINRSASLHCIYDLQTPNVYVLLSIYSMFLLFCCTRQIERHVYVVKCNVVVRETENC